MTAAASAGALDAATGLALAAPFGAALSGTFVRNALAAAANAHGLAAARIAAAGLATVDGTAEATLGRILGSFDPSRLTDGLGERFDVTRGYLKRHSACSYTHPAADAALALRERIGGAEVERVEVETHHLAAPLDGTRPPTRLAAMFSIPYVVAIALRHGDVGPQRFDDRHRDETAAAAARVRVRHVEALDDRLPAERVARVTVRLVGGEELSLEAPNPRGDADFHPLGTAEVEAKLHALLGPNGVAATARGLLSADDVRDVP